VSDNAELHAKILGFLMGEWAKKAERQLVSVELVYAPGNGFKDEEIRKWVRADEPELFAEFANIEELVKRIVDIAEGEADAKPAGKHRFIVRTFQHVGGRATHSFALSPSYRGSDELALAPGGGGGGGGRDQQVIANHASQLMRVNVQMFDGTIRVLGAQNMSLHEQLNTLTAENAMLRRELEEARSNKMDREYQYAMAAEKNARTNAAFQQVLRIGTVVAAKLTAGNEPKQEAGSSALTMLLTDFYSSLRQEQMATLMQTLDMSQKILFMEIANLIKPPDPEDGTQQAQQQPPGPPAA
jgi:hypothetical protein